MKTPGITPPHAHGHGLAASNDTIVVGGRAYPPGDVVRLLEPFVSEERRTRIDSVLAKRTRSIVPVIEGVHDLGNVGAIIRSAEGMGCQELHVIDRGDRLKKSRRTSQGSEKWIDLVKWSSKEDCITHLKARGLRLVVTHLEAAQPLESFDFSIPTAIAFGNEADGVSPELVSNADARCFIPMTGFAQSFNVSVAVAIALYHARHDRTLRLGRHGDLSDQEQTVLRARFYATSVNAAGRILRRLTS